jgi:ADP-ribose pyrophosphatase YjhB (NUDIX family)
MEDFILSNEERIKIFELLCENKKLSFNNIVKLTGIRSNKLSYQLNQMKEKNFLENDFEGYSLSIEAQRLVPYFSQIFKKEVGVLPVVLGIVRNKNKILLIQRKKMPYKGYWGLFGGKQISGETISETIEREVLEESNLKTKFLKCNGVIHERLKENDQFKHSFLFILTSVKAESLEVMEKEEGKVEWFDYDDVVNSRIPKVIPSDVEFLKKYAEKEIEIEDIVMEEKDQELVIKKQQNTLQHRQD